MSVIGSPTIANYDPFSGSDATVTFTVAVTNTTTGNNACDAAVSFQRAGTVAMANGASALAYSLESASSGVNLVTSSGFVAGSLPSAANRIDFKNIAKGSTVSANVVLRINRGLVVSAGGYFDSAMVLQLIELANDQVTPRSLLSSTTFSPSATVVAKCSLPAPSLSTMNFNSAISHGHANAGVVQRTTFSNVACTAPTRLRLSGAALQPTLATPPRTGFDNFINYRAAGVFASATATLTTATTSTTVDSVAKNTPNGATTNGTIDVDVNLVDGKPIIAGSYTGTLRVTIDPAL